MAAPPSPLPEALVEAYLERLGLSRPPVPDADALALLHRAHGERVPFENLDIHLGVPIELDPVRLVEKVVTARRGGFCYELNGAFATLLEALGFAVGRLEARVFAEGVPGIPFDHLALRVDVEGAWLVDVGFGSAFRDPIRLDRRDDQADPGGTFRLVDAGEGALDLLRDGEPLYRLLLAPRALGEFEPGCRHHQTSPESPFTRGTVCSLPTPDGGRATIRDATLILTAPDGSRTEEELGPDALGEAYRQHFGIDLPRMPRGPGAAPG